MKFAGWYSIVVGIMMFAQWLFFLAAGQVPEVKTAPVALGFHLTAEFATALALIISGITLLRGMQWGRVAALVSLGMLCYTVIVSPGYFAQQGTWPLVVMFMVLLILSAYCIWILAYSQQS
jgi:hypothetical protein